MRRGSYSKKIASYRPGGRNTHGNQASQARQKTCGTTIASSNAWPQHAVNCAGGYRWVWAGLLGDLSAVRGLRQSEHI